MSPNSMCEWDFPNDALVAAFDLLGFKSIMGERADLPNVAQKVSRLVEQVQGIAAEPTVFEFRGAVSSAVIRVAQASDTFVIYCGHSSPADVIQFLWNVQQLLFYAILDSFPLRGAITIGSVAASPSQHLFFGPAVLDALQLERAAEWAGAILSKTLQNRIEELGLDGHLHPLLLRYAPPLKQNCADVLPRECLCLNWLADWPNQISPDFIHSKFPPVLPEDREYLRVQRKIEHTRAFMRHAIESGPFIGPSNRRILLQPTGDGRRFIRFVLDR